MADSNKRPNEDDVEDTTAQVEASEDTSGLRAHLRMDDPGAIDAIEALVKQERVWGEGLDDVANPVVDPVFRKRLRDKLIAEGSEGDNQDEG